MRLKNELRRMKRSSEREMLRLEEMVEAYRAKVEIIQSETVDRILEMTRTLGTSASSIAWATRDANEKISNLRFRPFDVARQQARSGLRPAVATDLPVKREDLTENERSAYDAMFQTHREMGLANGLSEEDIRRFWDQNAHEDAIETVVSQFSSN